MRIIQQREKCIGCGSCVALCPKFFEMAEDGKSTLKGAKKNEKTGNFELQVKEIDCLKEAVAACPVEILKIEKE
jgi:ferredoxin